MNLNSILGHRTSAGIRLKCLGINRADRPVPKYIQCLQCGYDQIEIWSDEEKAKCDKCGATVLIDRSVCVDDKMLKKEIDTFEHSQQVRENTKPSAFIFIKSETGYENSVLRELKGMPSIKEAYVINGMYDLIAKVEANSAEKLKETISKNLHLKTHAQVRAIFITRNQIGQVA